MIRARVTHLDTERIRGLLDRVEKPPDHVLPGGVDPGVLEAARGRGVPLPGAFVEWLGLSNGPLVGPGGFYGLETEWPRLDLEDELAAHPLIVRAGWRGRGWVPVASDGFGNRYVLMPRGDDGPVAFFEMIHSAEEPEYVAASDLDHFLIGILEKELGAKWWPFEPEPTLEFDPGLASVEARLLPWMG